MANLISFIRHLFRIDESVTGDSSQSDLEFFNSLSGKLEIELTEPAEPVANLLNLAAKPEAEIVDVCLRTEIFEEKKQDFRDLTEAELSLVIFPEPRIRLRGESGDVVEHEAPNGKNFTVKEMLAAIEETERRTRGNSEWLGGIDVHHCYFEGIYQNENGIWEIYWGS
jgi:hypothetical protein